MNREAFEEVYDRVINRINNRYHMITTYCHKERMSIRQRRWHIVGGIACFDDGRLVLMNKKMAFTHPLGGAFVVANATMSRPRQMLRALRRLQAIDLWTERRLAGLSMQTLHIQGQQIKSYEALDAEVAVESLAGGARTIPENRSVPAKLVRKP